MTDLFLSQPPPRFEFHQQNVAFDAGGVASITVRCSGRRHYGGLRVQEAKEFVELWSVIRQAVFGAVDDPVCGTLLQSGSRLARRRGFIAMALAAVRARAAARITRSMCAEFFLVAKRRVPWLILC
jgi:hypothetical protein